MEYLALDEAFLRRKALRERFAPLGGALGHRAAPIPLMERNTYDKKILHVV
ncbi:hypothetical protein [Selenomonas dianae]|uniref:hypothetical protein n=1 Tax=Selenomonas dianae TaxID=135079 RepID=UPI00272C8F6F|nr:hypothetical protein [Selenomonas dianae]WLD82105.1 hypothetical protein QU667_09860 [Selenomonas dianae]